MNLFKLIIMNKDIAKQITLLEKKKEYCTNDLFKLVAIDLVWLLEHEELDPTPEYKKRIEGIFKNLHSQYTKKLHELRKLQKINTKQLEITD